MGIGSLPGQPGTTAVPDPRLGPEMERLMANMGRTFQTIPVYETAVVQHVQMDGLGRPAYAITDKGYRLDLSLGTPIREAEEWVIRGEGGPAGRRWQALYRSNSHGDLLGPIAGRFIPPPIIPAAIYGGIVSAEQGNSTTDPGGASLASITVYPRSVSISGNYDVYNQHFPILHWRSRIWGSDDWSKTNSLNFHPAAPVYLTLTGPILADTLTATVVPDPDANAEIELTHLLFWRIDGEAVVGSYDGTHLTISQRGVDGTDAAAHDTGARIELLSLRVPLTDFAQNTHYELQFSFGGSFAEIGVWSDSIDLVTFAITQRPAPPSGVIVDLNNDEFEIRWTPPPDASVKQFRILRYDGGLPSPGAYAEAYLTGGAVDLGIIAGHTITIGANGVHTGTGHNFGVASRNNAGLESIVVWNNDAWVPTSPDPAGVHLIPVPSGVLVQITDQEQLRRSGFQNYRVYAADDQSGTNARYVVDLAPRQLQGTLPAESYGVNTTYQVISRNWLNQESGLDNTPAHGYWKYAQPLYPTGAYPVNGNFELPNADLSMPLYWSVRYGFYYWNSGQVVDQPPGMSARYDQTNGVAGSRALVLHSDGQTGINALPAEITCFWVVTSLIRIPYNRLKGTQVTLWVKPSRRWPDASTFCRAGIGVSTDALGTHPSPSSPAPMYSMTWQMNPGQTSPAPFDPSGYNKIGPLGIFDATNTSEGNYAVLALDFGTTDTGTPMDIFLDDVVLVFDVPVATSDLIVTPGTIAINPGGVKR